MSSTVEVIGESVEFIFCHCGCKKTRPRFDKYGEERFFIIGHQRAFKGKKFSEEHKMKISQALMGSNNGMWKSDEGNDVNYMAIHRWVRRHFWPTRLCQLCMLVQPYDLANITNIYNRDFRNWRYYCRLCHMRSDDRIFNLKNQINAC